MKKIKIFDTTLRDGEQCLDTSLAINEKLEIAQQLERLNVDIIEAGFPIVSKNEFLSVKKIAETVKSPVICALGRAVKKDLDSCWEAIKASENPRIHTFIATSDLHMQYKLKKSAIQVLEIARFGVEHAKNYCDDIEFTTEDGSRSDFEFLCEVIETVIDSGATTINIPDTVGYAQPEEFGRLIKSIKTAVPKINKINLSVHCHNDLGVGVANTLQGIKNGANQVECTINGIGERAGNAALEEIVMALKTRESYYKSYTDIKTEELNKTSKLVSKITDLIVQKSKAIVGENAFAHKAGIHQDGMLKNKLTYEIINPEDVGWIGKEITIGKHSGKHAIQKLLQKNRIDVNEIELEIIQLKIKEFVDINNSISNEKIIEIAKKKIN